MVFIANGLGYVPLPTIKLQKLRQGGITVTGLRTRGYEEPPYFENRMLECPLPAKIGRM